MEKTKQISIVLKTESDEIKLIQEIKRFINSLKLDSPIEIVGIHVKVLDAEKERFTKNAY